MDIPRLRPEEKSSYPCSYCNDIHCCFTMLVNLNTNFPCFTSAQKLLFAMINTCMVKQTTLCSVSITYAKHYIMLIITSGSSWLYVEWNAQSATFRVLYRESGAPDYQVIAPPTSQPSSNICSGIKYLARNYQDFPHWC